MPHFKKGDLVWAKMKGFPPWPGNIVEAPAEIKKPSQANKKPFHCVYFYGSENYAWMAEESVKDYAEFREKFCKVNKPSQQLREAIEQSENVFQEYLVFKKKRELNEFNEDIASHFMLNIEYNTDILKNKNNVVRKNSTTSSIDLPSINDELDAIFQRSNKNHTDDSNHKLDVNEIEESEEYYYEDNFSHDDENEINSSNDDFLTDEDLNGKGVDTNNNHNKKRSHETDNNPTNETHASNNINSIYNGHDDDKQLLDKDSIEENVNQSHKSPQKHILEEVFDHSDTDDRDDPSEDNVSGDQNLKGPNITMENFEKDEKNLTSLDDNSSKNIEENGKRKKVKSLDKEGPDNTPKRRNMPARSSQTPIFLPKKKHTNVNKEEILENTKANSTLNSKSLNNSPPTQSTKKIRSDNNNNNTITPIINNNNKKVSKKTDNSKAFTNSTSSSSSNKLIKKYSQNGRVRQTTSNTSTVSQKHQNPGTSAKSTTSNPTPESNKQLKSVFDQSNLLGTTFETPPFADNDRLHSAFDDEVSTITPKYFKNKDYSPLNFETTEAEETAYSLTNELENIQSRSLKIGFLGTGILGKQIVHTLLNAGHQICVWNRDSFKCQELIKAGATDGVTPENVMSTCNIIFCCFSEHNALRKIILNSDDIIKFIKEGKGIVNLSSNTYKTASDMAEVIQSLNSRYLEAPVFGSNNGDNATFLILAAGDSNLYKQCEPLFKLIGRPLYLGFNETHSAKIALILKSLQGTLIASLAESLSLAEKSGIKPDDIVSILKISMLDCPLFRQKGKEIIEGLFLPNLPLKHQQSDCKLTLDMADSLEHPTPLLSTANELFKRAKNLGCGNNDISAVHKAFYL